MWGLLLWWSSEKTQLCQWECRQTALTLLFGWYCRRLETWPQDTDFYSSLQHTHERVHLKWLRMEYTAYTADPDKQRFSCRAGHRKCRETRPVLYMICSVVYVAARLLISSTIGVGSWGRRVDLNQEFTEWKAKNHFGSHIYIDVLLFTLNIKFEIRHYCASFWHLICNKNYPFRAPSYLKKL